MDVKYYCLTEVYQRAQRRDLLANRKVIPIESAKWDDFPWDKCQWDEYRWQKYRRAKFGF